MNLSQEQRDALDEIVTRRVNATGETRKQASVQVAEYLAQIWKNQQTVDLND